MSFSNVKIKAKEVSATNLKDLMKLKREDITLSLLQKYFAFTEKSDPIYSPNDYFTLPANKLYNKTAIKTTVGRYIFNLFIIDETMSKYFEYMNYTLDKDAIEDIDAKMAELLLNDKITINIFADYIDRMQWIGFSIAKFINSSMTTDLVILPDNIAKRKEKLIKDNKEALDKGDLVTLKKIEDELIDLSKNIFEDLADTEIFDSKCSKGNWTNSYKNMTLMRGCIRSLDGDPTKTTISTSSLEEGIPPQELHNYADILNQGSYSRAISTRDGGYETKKLSASFQSVVIDDEGTDCHTTKFLKILVTDNNVEYFINRYIKKGNQLVLLTNENKSQFINKVCEFRSPLFCLGDKICNKCAGELFYKMGIKDVGLICSNIGSAVLNASLKQFHDLSLKLTEIDLDDYID